ncbi:MAG: TVP38/TMEM64 family protein [Oscillospiraceae bacterium]|jgi:uncharacterized membrane protein YdjX (TVP38/TMEM64 family)|nr:TVP38/TMEM64 family protein [Oscillospiraceae bacterium]
MSFKESQKKHLYKIIPIAATVICTMLFVLAIRPALGQSPASLLPQNRWLAFLVVILLYAVKSLTVVFPLITLYLLSGAVFSLPSAILVNLLGLVFWASIPYLLGKLIGPSRLERLRKRYPKLEILDILRRKSGVWFTVLARASGPLPGDIVSLYFGCMGLGFPSYLAGSILGVAPTMVAATVLGEQISHPNTPGFWIAAAASAAVALASLLACRRAVRERNH